MAQSGTIEITPGKILAAGEKASRSKLNLLGKPTGRIGAGAVGERELDDEAVRAIVPNVNRNAIINGNFDIWQRGGYTNLVGLPAVLGASALYEYGADRWSLGLPSGANKRAISRQSFVLGQTAVPNAPTYYLKWDQQVSETAPTLAQPIEDVRTFAGKVVTVSWWMKAEQSITVLCKLVQDFGVGWGGPSGSTQQRVITASSGGTVNLIANAQWVKYTATFSIPDLVGYTDAGGDPALILEFIMPAGVFKVYYAQVQTEQSSKATTYETKSRQFEFDRCQRYFEYHAGIAVADDIETVSIPIDLASITAAGDVLTEYVPGYAFKVLSVSFAVSVPAATAGKAVTLNLEIETANVTGGAVALTTANCSTLGALVAGSAITALNTGTATQKLSVEAASVTAFAQGQGMLLIRIQKTGTTKPCYYFATRKYAIPVLTVLTGYQGAGLHFTPLLDVGYYQDTGNSEFTAFFIQAEAELKI